MEMRDTNSVSPSRRQFLKAGSAGLAGAALLTPQLSQGAFAEGKDTIKIGLVGCGGRGTGAVSNAMEADPGVVLVAMGDVFEDHLKSSYKRSKKAYQDRVQVDDDHKFIGFDAYKKTIDACDVVLLATPPHFRPEHVRYAVEQGKHIFCEKPVGVDPAGVRQVAKACEEAKKKNLSIVSGLCYRYHPAIRAAFNEVAEGRIGDVVSARCSYFTGGLWQKPRQENWSDMEYQLRNWLYYTWLSGDHINEQHIHSIDKLLWGFGDQDPVSATATGGRFLRTAPKYGHVYDHFATEFEFDERGSHVGFSRCRQQDPCMRDVTDTIFGTKGTLHIATIRAFIIGEKPWRYRGEGGNMYVVEHEHLYRSIREGKPINNGDYMCRATLAAITGREAAYSGDKVRWEELVASDVHLGPEKYEWSKMPEYAVRKPGDGRNWIS